MKMSIISIEGQPSSHPSRGAWIEILEPWRRRTSLTSRTPHGVRGLKYKINAEKKVVSGRTPHGVRGLKYYKIVGLQEAVTLSHPSRGAWIEIQGIYKQLVTYCMSHPSRGAWIEMPEGSAHGHGPDCRTPHGVRGLKCAAGQSLVPHESRTPHGVRGLKYGAQNRRDQVCNVAPLTGCVD